MEIMILCLRPLPAANGGWNSAKWRIPKLAAPVSVRPVQVADWQAALEPEMRSALKELLAAPFVAGLRMEGPATTFEVAVAYAGIVAEACAGVVVLGDEIAADRRASVHVWSGPQIEQRWRAIDAEAARSDPEYQPVRGINDDQRPTQTFTFPIVIDGVELTAPMAREAVVAHVAMATAAPTAPAARAVTATTAATAAPVQALSEADGTVPMDAEMVNAALRAAPEPATKSTATAKPAPIEAEQTLDLTVDQVSERIEISEISEISERTERRLERGAERLASGSEPPPPAASTPVMTTPVTSRAVTGERRAVIESLDQVPSEQTYDSATSAGDEDWSEVMPE